MCEWKKQTNPEATSTFIYVNRPGSKYNEFREIPVYDEAGNLNKEAAKKGGFYLLTSIECKNGKLPDFSKGTLICDDGSWFSIWITHEGKQPFRYVTRKEFLEKQIAIHQAELKDLNNYYTSAQWLEVKKMMESAGKKEEAGKMKQMALSMAEKPLAAYRDDLKKDASWLNEIAVVKYMFDPATKFSRHVFTHLNDPAMSVPIMPNPDYYNQKLPKWAPQFILVDLPGAERYYQKNVRRVIENNLEFFKSLWVSK